MSVLVLFGSQKGNAGEVAELIHDELSRCVAVKEHALFSANAYLKTDTTVRHIPA